MQQPALVATSIACLRAVEAAGVRPDVVVGHSVGEYSALAACGALADRDAVELVRERGLATAAAASEHPGAMTAIIGLEDAVVEELCAGIEDVWPANYNCPGQLVVSSSERSVDELLERATAAGARRAIRLRVPGAFHSPLVASAAARLRPALERVTWHEPEVPFLSTVTARVEPIGALPGLLLDQLTAPVRFTQAVAELVRLGVTYASRSGRGRCSPVSCGAASARSRPIRWATPRRSPSSRRCFPLPDVFGSLDGKVALVTGGARGIGAAVSRELAGAGARVAINYRSGAEAATAVAAEIGGVAVQADVADAAQVGDARGASRSRARPARHPRRQRRRHPRHADRPNDGRGVGRTSSRRTCAASSTCCRAVASGMLKRRSGSIVNADERRRPTRQSPDRRTTRLPKPASSASRSRWRRSSEAEACA